MSLENEKKQSTIYHSFFEECLGPIRKDIFTDELMVRSGSYFEPAINKLETLRSHALDDTSGNIKKEHVKDHLLRLSDIRKPEFLIEIPTWDQMDRVKLLSKSIQCKNFDERIVYELLLDWGSKIFSRLENPHIQNRLLILKGPQGVGKDTFLDSILGALGQYYSDLTISKNEKDNHSAISSLLIARISEFDRTARTDVSTMKDLITRSHTFFRKAYAHAEKYRPVRCSFVATVNVDEILRDHTGNRRFIIFDIEKILWNYPTEDSSQILAQFLFYCQNKYEASKNTEAALAAYLSMHKPENFEEQILESYLAAMNQYEKMNDKKKFYTLTDIKSVVSDVTSLMQIKTNVLLGILNRSGFSRRVGSGMQYTSKKINK